MTDSFAESLLFVAVWSIPTINWSSFFLSFVAASAPLSENPLRIAQPNMKFISLMQKSSFLNAEFITFNATWGACQSTIGQNRPKPVAFTLKKKGNLCAHQSPCPLRVSRASFRATFSRSLPWCWDCPGHSPSLGWTSPDPAKHINDNLVKHAGAWYIRRWRHLTHLHGQFLERDRRQQRLLCLCDRFIAAFGTKNDELCIKNDEICIQNDESFIKNAEMYLCQRLLLRAALVIVVLVDIL